MNRIFLFLFQTTHACAIRFVNKFALVCGQIQLVLNLAASPKGCSSNLVARKLVSLKVFIMMHLGFFYFLLYSRILGLVIDGGIAYPFNDGAKILLEVNPEDTLLTITLNETLEP